MSFSRRNFLKGSAAGAALLGVPGLSRLSFAQEATDGDLLIVFYQRGGCDGLNLFAPVDDPSYLAVRTDDLRVNESGSFAGLPLKNGLAGVDFRFHPNAGPIKEIYDSDQLAIVEAVGLDHGTRSHFDAQAMMERGVSDLALRFLDQGWLTRHIEVINGGGALPVVAASYGTPEALLGQGLAVAIPDLSEGLDFPLGAGGLDLTRSFYEVGSSAIHGPGRVAIQTLDTINANLPTDADGNLIPYQPENGAVYPDRNMAAKGLRTIAQIIKMELGLQVATVDMQGWDTHDNQFTRMNNLITDMSLALNAFWNDVSAFHNQITVVVMTEFGRRLLPSQSAGTDHGKATAFMVMGGRIAGGRMYGTWPGLTEEQLDRGLDLAVTTDYRDLLAEVIRESQGNSQADFVFPGYAVNQTLGLFSNT